LTQQELDKYKQTQEELLKQLPRKDREEKEKISIDERDKLYILQCYRDALLSKITLSWKSSNNLAGIIPLQSIVLTHTMLQKLKSQMLNVELSLLDATMKETPNCYSCKIGQLANITANVTNIAAVQRNSLVLNIQPFRNSAFNEVSTELGHKLAWAGSTHIKLPEVSLGQTYIHKFKVIFLSPGTYQFVCKCTGEKGNGVWSSQKISVYAFADIA